MLDIKLMLHYASNPPQGEATHYNTLGGLRSDYMLHDDHWFYHNGKQWVFMQSEPPVKTPVGEVEPLRVWYPKPIEKAQPSQFNEGSYYSRFD